MLKRLFIVYAFLLSYSGAIAHSIVPHHHHVSTKEAKGHHHHGTTNHSHDDNSKKDKDHEGEPYFLTHHSNTDAALNHSLVDSPTKGKKIHLDIELSELFFSITLSNPAIFRPPGNERLSQFECFHSRSLRAPPFFIV
jgi:hypothetical protein